MLDRYLGNLRFGGLAVPTRQSDRSVDGADRGAGRDHRTARLCIPAGFPVQGLIIAVGILGFNLQLALGGQMFLTYPSGRPAGPGTRRLIIAGYVLAILGVIGRLAVYHTYVIDCGDRCGINMGYVAPPFAEFLSRRPTSAVQYWASSWRQCWCAACAEPPPAGGASCCCRWVPPPVPICRSR